MSVNKNIVWCPSEDGWFVYDEVEQIIDFCSTYTEALEIFTKYCRDNFPELYNE